MEHDAISALLSMLMLLLFACVHHESKLRAFFFLQCMIISATSFAVRLWRILLHFFNFFFARSMIDCKQHIIICYSDENEQKTTMESFQETQYRRCAYL